MHSQRVDHNQILQGKLAKIRQHHTTFTGYISRPQTRTDPSSTAKFAYLTRRNFGLEPPRALVSILSTWAIQ